MREVCAAERGTPVLIGLGSNLGDSARLLLRAADALCAVMVEARVSRLYRSPPEDGTDQPDFFNAVVAGVSRESPRALLRRGQALEAAAGRVRTRAGGPRTLDVDLLFHGDTVMDAPDLTLPHPRWRERAFVVLPLLEVAPEWVDPASGMTVAEVAAERGWPTAAPAAPVGDAAGVR